MPEDKGDRSQNDIDKNYKRQPASSDEPQEGGTQPSPVPYEDTEIRKAFETQYRDTVISKLRDDLPFDSRNEFMEMLGRNPGGIEVLINYEDTTTEVVFTIEETTIKFVAEVKRIRSERYKAHTRYFVEKFEALAASAVEAFIKSMK